MWPFRKKMNAADFEYRLKNRKFVDPAIDDIRVEMIRQHNGWKANMDVPRIVVGAKMNLLFNWRPDRDRVTQE